MNKKIVVSVVSANVGGVETDGGVRHHVECQYQQRVAHERVGADHGVAIDARLAEVPSGKEDGVTLADAVDKRHFGEGDVLEVECEKRVASLLRGVADGVVAREGVCVALELYRLTQIDGVVEMEVVSGVHGKVQRDDTIARADGKEVVHVVPFGVHGRVGKIDIAALADGVVVIDGVGTVYMHQ